MLSKLKKQCLRDTAFYLCASSRPSLNIDRLAKSLILDGKVKSFKFKARKSRGMRSTYVYAAMTRDAAEHRSWIFYEAINIVSQRRSSYISFPLFRNSSRCFLFPGRFEVSLKFSIGNLKLPIAPSIHSQLCQKCRPDPHTFGALSIVQTVPLHFLTDGRIKNILEYIRGETQCAHPYLHRTDHSGGNIQSPRLTSRRAWHLFSDRFPKSYTESVIL